MRYRTCYVLQVAPDLERKPTTRENPTTISNRPKWCIAQMLRKSKAKAVLYELCTKNNNHTNHLVSACPQQPTSVIEATQRLLCAIANRSVTISSELEAEWDAVPHPSGAEPSALLRVHVIRVFLLPWYINNADFYIYGMSRERGTYSKRR